MTTKYLALLPRDGFFVKDGRGWYTSSSGRGHGLDWPLPSTVLGALRTAWGRGEDRQRNTPFSREEWKEKTKQIELGRTLVLRRKPGSAWCDSNIVWPVPQDALWFKEGAKDVCRLDPVPRTATMPHTLGRVDDAREHLWRSVLEDAKKPKVAPRWWNHEDFTFWLAGKSVAVRTDKEDKPATDHIREKDLVSTKRVQVHVGISPEQGTAKEGILYSHDVIETLDKRDETSSGIAFGEWAIGVEIALPNDRTPRVVTLGSGSRLACVEPLPDDSLFTAPKGVLEAFRGGSRGLRLVAVSPLCFGEGWLPDGFKEEGSCYQGTLAGLGHKVILRAAFVNRPIHVSGWDMETNTPKSISRMVPPGSVYFFQRADGKSFTEDDATSLWLASIGARTEEGFGRVVPGVWSPKEDKQCK